MSSHPERIQQVMRYAVAVAANQDDSRRRELGPIHLIKYVYLADLAYAEGHGGKTYTGIDWRFYHFGPYATEAWQQIDAAMAHPGIHHRSFQGRYQDDVSRWSTKDPRLEERLEEDLPFAAARAVKAAVREFSNDTPSLLHYAYRTAPMLRAAPGEVLDFSAVVPQEAETPHAQDEEERRPALSKTARKRRKEAHEELRQRFQEALKKSMRARSSTPKPRPPRYDKVFAEGTDGLDSLAGKPIKAQEGELIVSETIWKSPARSEPGIP